MSVFFFYIIVTILALCIVGGIGEALAALFGYIHPWDFT